METNRRRHRPSILIPLLTAGAHAAAQPCKAQESVSYSWSFLEVVTGTNNPVPLPNGILEPGEGARLALKVTVSPAIGSTSTYTPPPPPGVGTIAGLGSVFFDLLQTGAAGGTWGFLTRAPGWALGDIGQPQANGSVVGCQAGQFTPPPQVANPQNPIPAIWSGVWTPSTYFPRTVQFRSGPGGRGGPSSSILIRYGTDPTGAPLYVGKFVASLHGEIAIPVVPAPSTALPLLFLLISRCDRRRSAHRIRADR